MKIIIIIIYQNKIKYLTIAYVQFYINCFSASYSYNRHIEWREKKYAGISLIVKTILVFN